MEGRIKITYKFFLLISLVVLFFSCANNPKNNTAIFNAFNESLVNSNEAIDKSSQSIYTTIQNKLTDPSTSYKAEIWYPKAMIVNNLSKIIFTYIEELKELVKQKGVLEDEKAKELYTKLKEYKNKIMGIDSGMTAVFDTSIIITTRSFDSSSYRRDDFTKTFFDYTQREVIFSILSKFQNNIKIIENRMAAFCNSNIPSSERFYDRYSAIVAQSSSYVKAGEKIEITAGVGVFSINSKPVVIINGKNIQLRYDGTVHYQFNASNKQGIHYIPVEITFTDEVGKKQRINKPIEYTVVQ
jgi:hypothetical protein